MADNAPRFKSPSHTIDAFYYVLSSDGCDETFDVYRGNACIASFPFWEEKAQAEAQAKRLVALLQARKRR